MCALFLGALRALTIKINEILRFCNRTKRFCCFNFLCARYFFLILNSTLVLCVWCMCLCENIFFFLKIRNIHVFFTAFTFVIVVTGTASVCGCTQFYVPSSFNLFFLLPLDSTISLFKCFFRLHFFLFSMQYYANLQKQIGICASYLLFSSFPQPLYILI